MAAVEKAIQWLLNFAEKIHQEKEYLNQLDTAIGDGDHGSNMDRGMQLFKEKLVTQEYTNLNDLFRDAGMTLISKVGGASGPLYGSAFISMAKQSSSSDGMSAILFSGLEGIQHRGKASIGEKTMIDVWLPCCEALKSGTLTFESIEEALQQTKEMKATKGRASYLGERSIGHLDPGACSSAYLFEELLKVGRWDD